MIHIIIIGTIVFVISNCFYQIGITNGNSMYPTLKNNELFIIKKYNFKIHRNDIVVVKKNKRTIIKRVVGLPYDIIEIKNNKLFINCIKQDDSITKQYEMKNKKILLKENEYFILGDNREKSIDSRFDEIGLINKKNIVGVVINKE